MGFTRNGRRRRVNSQLTGQTAKLSNCWKARAKVCAREALGMELEVGEAVSFCTECFAPLYFLAATRRHAHGHRHSPVQCAYIPSPKSCTPTQTHHQLPQHFACCHVAGARSVVDVEWASSQPLAVTRSGSEGLLLGTAQRPVGLVVGSHHGQLACPEVRGPLASMMPFTKRNLPLILSPGLSSRVTFADQSGQVPLEQSWSSSSAKCSPHQTKPNPLDV